MDAKQFDGITKSLSIAMMVATLLVGSGVARAETLTCNSTPPCYGTPEGDSIEGTASGETINALGGIDLVLARDGNDIVNGGPGADALYGMGGSDKVSGGKGNDTIEELVDSVGSTDSLFGGSGNDRIVANEGNKDIIDCGTGIDTVFYDVGIDTIKGCENKNP